MAKCSKCRGRPRIPERFQETAHGVYRKNHEHTGKDAAQTGISFPPEQEQAHHTRERIIQAAVRQLKEKGYANMSLDSIAREAGVASQTVYAVCGSKKGALARILESTVAEQKYDKIRDSIPQMKTGEERVATMARFHSLMQHNSASGLNSCGGPESSRRNWPSWKKTMT